MTQRVLLVDDDAAVREALAQTLELNDIAATVTGSFIEAKDHISRAFPGVILSDIRMPGRDGFHLLDFTRSVDSDLPVVLLTGEGDIPMAVRAMGEGAFDFLEKPCAPTDLVAVLRRALDARQAVLRDRAERRRTEEGDAASRLIFGLSDRSEALRAAVRAAGRADTEALVISPPGGGVSKVAEALHLCAPRANGPFVKAAARGLTPDAIDAGLAGAEGGSLFLDDIGALGADGQVHLADVLERGATARVIAGAGEALEAEVGAGGFSADLYYRLNVMTVRIPPLAERPEDIPELFRRYVAQAAEQSGQPAPEVTPAVIAGLMARDWPGNARALMTEAMRFVLGVGEGPDGAADMGLAEQMAQVERSLLVNALTRHKGQASETARALKLPRKTFYDKLARYGLKPETYR
ncbi:sigma-54-dependent transcriptional regulator [Pseudaestuariivita atlantica]|uniref:Chemotaxis protein CheY n=1 Tax=Pseudaestuariivita atlantica TaxID=1317121 RepID=A0A0L1JLS0_9RHOB|nr:sigma-54 dependent transcriptional regulator [Pseudaestuariivita atlantica]KNG92353.1 chemotaxis protein CheY [Pseudaestuariivita atlantica]